MQYGGKVWEPLSTYEEELIIKILGLEFNVVWLGITDFRQFGNFVRDSNGEELTYSNWNIRSPFDDLTKRGSYHCTIMPMVGIIHF